MVAPLLSSRARFLSTFLVAALLAVAAMALVAARSSTADTKAATAGIVSIYVKVTGHKQGVFKGDSPAKNHTDQIVVSGYLFQLDSPRDIATGQATGRRQYKPVVVTHELDAASPQFVSACAQNEILDKVVIDFFKTDRTGKQINFYRVTLTNATLSSVKQYSAGPTVNEDDSFTFQKILQEDLVAKTSFQDDWQSSSIS